MARTVTAPTNSARSVAGLMGFAVGFSLLGNEINVAKGAKPDKLASGLDKGATIMVGGFVAAALLTALTGAGEAGRKFAVGLAGVTAATSLLVYGGPVWQLLGNLVGSKGNTGATTPTSNTQPTAGTSTVVALSNVAGG
jgi:hypothetical protein